MSSFVWDMCTLWVVCCLWCCMCCVLCIWCILWISCVPCTFCMFSMLCELCMLYMACMLCTRCVLCVCWVVRCSVCCVLEMCCAFCDVLLLFCVQSVWTLFFVNCIMLRLCCVRGCSAVCDMGVVHQWCVLNCVQEILNKHTLLRFFMCKRKYLLELRSSKIAIYPCSFFCGKYTLAICTLS